MYIYEANNQLYVCQQSHVNDDPMDHCHMDKQQLQPEVVIQ